MSNLDHLKKQIDEVFDASPGESCETSAPVDESFWDKTIVVEFTNTMYLPNEYTIDSDLHDLEVLAFAYENNDQYARESLSNEDALCVWGWIVKKRTGRYPNSLELIDKKAKRLRRREMGPSVDTIIDCRVTPIPARSRSDSGNSNNRPRYGAYSKKKPAPKSELEDAAQHIQAAAQIIGDAAADGIKEAAQRIEKAAKEVDLTEAKQNIEELAKNAQIVAGVAEQNLKKWLKKINKKDEK